jgi:hypothetical protein
VYDEVCTLLTGALVREMQEDLAPAIPDMHWQMHLMAKVV